MRAIDIVMVGVDHDGSDRSYNEDFPSNFRHFLSTKSHVCGLQTFTMHFVRNVLGNREHSHMHAKIADPENWKDIYGGNKL